MQRLISALAALLFVAAPAMADITGPARVVDGDNRAWEAVSDYGPWGARIASAATHGAA